MMGGGGGGVESAHYPSPAADGLESIQNSSLVGDHLTSTTSRDQKKTKHVLQSLLLRFQEIKKVRK